MLSSLLLLFDLIFYEQCSTSEVGCREFISSRAGLSTSPIKPHPTPIFGMEVVMLGLVGSAH